jgi:protein tyrosine phosphatase (PTP) superfamily phosphohydrolase (DUF442 family)
MMQTVTDVLNFLPISESLGTAGQPTPEQFSAIGQAGYQLVINLAMPDSSNALPDEAELVEAQGLGYVHIPVVWESPTLDDVARFFDVMDRHRGDKVFVHCALNMRVSCFVLLYRVIRLGEPLAEAVETMRLVWEPNEVWRVFVDEVLAYYGLPARLPSGGS